MSDIFTPDFSEAPEKETAPEGKYTMAIRGNPKVRLGTSSQKPYLVWEFEHTIDENRKYGLVFENTPLTGKGAFRLRDLLKALGYKDDAAQTFRVKPLGELTMANAKTGVAVDLVLAGEAWNPAGRTIEVTLAVDTNEGKSAPKNVVSRYFAPRA